MERDLLMIKLYHGTNESSALSIVNDGIDLSKSKKYLDFGPGFYMTDDIKRRRSGPAVKRTSQTSEWHYKKVLIS